MVVTTLPEPLTHHQFLTAGYISIKAFSGFDAEVAGGDHVGQQRAWGVFRIAETLVQYL